MQQMPIEDVQHSAGRVPNHPGVIPDQATVLSAFTKYTAPSSHVLETEPMQPCDVL